MKKIMIIALAASSVMGAPAMAAGTHSSSSTEYSNPILQEIQTFGLNTFFDEVQNGATLYYSGFPVSGSGTLNHTQLGSRYRQSSSAPDDTETATSTAGGTFTLQGQVSADCSFYNGASADHTIDLGAIGVRTGDADNVTIAFNQAATATAHVDTATAGCNTQNTVSISKLNGTQGLVNASPSAYDTAQFTAHIPYTLNASWTGAGTNTAIGSGQSLAVNPGQASNTATGGAWRSAFNLDVTIPAQSLGLVAGQYQDKITVTLSVS